MIPGVDYIRVLPEIILTVFGTTVMMMEAGADPRDSRRAQGWVAFAGVMLALFATHFIAYHPETYFGTAFFGMVRVDTFSTFFHVLILSVSAVVLLASFEYLETQNLRMGEFYALVLLGTVGMTLMSSAVELVLIFIALEISSISTYVLAGFRRRTPISTESSLKYFLLGSFATAFFLYGVALMFGATGSTSIAAISESLRGGNDSALVYVAVALMFVGLGFKVASAPFHVWTPDVYEGAPSPVVALMSTGPKAAVFAVLLRVLFETGAPGWFWLIWVSAVLSMTLGNIGALVQTNIKRLLAYSSIAHAGYVLVAFAAAEEAGISAAIFYAAAYAAMNVGAFAVVSHIGRGGERYVMLDDYSGLAGRSPVLAATLAVFMLSLIGIPLTGGFFAKFYVFSAALRADLVWLTVIGLVNSGVAAYYYLRVIVVMYMREPREELPPLRPSAALSAALAISVAATLWLGILPGSVLDYAASSARDLLR